MGVAALISWFVTAFVGLYLLAVWLIENDVTQQGAARSRLPGPVILGHVLLALTGLVFWVIHLVSHSSALGWTALGTLVAIGRNTPRYSATASSEICNLTCDFCACS